MKIRIASLALGLAFALPVGAHAQSADARYCKALGDSYMTYLGNGGDPRHQAGPNVNATEAMAKCQAGDTAAGIPPLEKALSDAKIALPARS